MIFTPAELTQLATAPADLGLAALDLGDRESARSIAEGATDAHFVLRDLYTAWNVLTLAYLERELGSEAARDCLEHSLREVVRPIAEWFRDGVTCDAVTRLAQLVRMDAGRLSALVEDSGTIVLSASGWIGARAAALAAPGLPDMWMVTALAERLCTGWLGYPPFVLEPGAGADELRVVIHKDPHDVPSAVFERLGLRRDEDRLDRVFESSGAALVTDNGRTELSEQSFVLAVRALDRGDDRAARRYLVRSKTEWLPMHDLLRDWGTAMHGWLARRKGSDAAWRCWDAVYNGQVLKPMLAQVEHLDTRTQVQMMAGMFHQHAMRFTIVETDAGFDFRTTPCGSGGRLITRHTDAEPTPLTMIPGPSVESFGAVELPVYCMHCPATNKMLLEDGGPYFLLVDPDIHEGRVRGHCSFHIFKHASAVPASMYERVGLAACGNTATAMPSRPS